MKRVLVKIVFLIFIRNVGYSQEIILPLEDQYSSGDPHTNVYYKDITGYLDTFVGTWEYSSSSVYLKVQFYKRLHAKGSFGIFDTIFEDELRSFILYKVFENGTWVTKYNTFAIVLISDEQANKNSIRGNLKGVGDNKLILGYTEPTTQCRRRKAASLELEVFEENGVQKLKWARKRPRNNHIGDGVCPDGTLWDESDFIIPANMILTKVN